MQTKDGKKAQGITSAEFTEIMAKLKGILDATENMRKLKRGERWLYSYDSDKVHMGVDLTDAGI